MPYKILIADDEKITLHLLEKYILMDDKSYILLKAFDGQNALDIATKKQPNAIIINNSIPLLSSEDFLVKLRQVNNIKNIPVIILISNTEESAMLKLLDLGAFDFIIKPINRIDLTARLKAAIKLNEALTEITIQKQKIDTHIDELNKLSLIVKETDNAVIIFSPDGEIEWANDAFKKMYGISIEEFVDRYGNNVLDASFSKNIIREKIDDLLENGKSVSYFSHVTGVNTIVDKWIQTTLTPIYNENNEIDKIVAIESDITKMKNYEIDLENKNKEMQKLADDLKLAYTELQAKNELIIEERRKTEQLIESILPHHVASQLKNEGTARPRNYKVATIMFTDIQGFTKSCEDLSPDQIVKYLDGFFRVFDDIIVEHFVEKIKTIGDAYMCVGGVPLRNRSNPYDVTLSALRIQHFMNNLDLFDPDKELPRWKIRLGMHTGQLTAGVVGKIKFAYDVWGDAVNVASRIESACEAGRVNVSGTTFELIKDFFECEYRGEIEMKNRGKMPMYFVNRIKKEYSEDEVGVFPNEKFKKFLHNL